MGILDALDQPVASGEHPVAAFDVEIGLLFLPVERRLRLSPAGSRTPKELANLLAVLVEHPPPMLEFAH
jgi:hypothetical protein